MFHADIIDDIFQQWSKLQSKLNPKSEKEKDKIKKELAIFTLAWM